MSSLTLCEQTLAKLPWAVLRLYGQGDQWQDTPPGGEEDFSEVNTSQHSIITSVLSLYFTDLHPSLLNEVYV